LWKTIYQVPFMFSDAQAEEEEEGKNKLFSVSQFIIK
jgi:hypothetical protein